MENTKTYQSIKLEQLKILKTYQSNIAVHNSKHNWSLLGKILDASRQHAKRLYGKFKNNYSNFIFHGNKNKIPWNKLIVKFIKNVLNKLYYQKMTRLMCLFHQIFLWGFVS